MLPPGSALGVAPAGGGRLSLCRPAAAAERVRSGPDTSALGCPARIEPEHGTGKLWALDEAASKGKPGNATCCYYELP